MAIDSHRITPCKGRLLREKTRLHCRTSAPYTSIGEQIFEIALRRMRRAADDRIVCGGTRIRCSRQLISQGKSEGNEEDQQIQKRRQDELPAGVARMLARGGRGSAAPSGRRMSQAPEPQACVARKSPIKPARVPRARNARKRQRQRRDRCVHRLPLRSVATGRKWPSPMSPGIVRFTSPAAMRSLSSRLSSMSNCWCRDAPQIQSGRSAAVDGRSISIRR